MIDQSSPTWAIASITTTGTVVNFTQNVRDSGTTQLFAKDLLLFNNANGSAFGCVTTVVATTSGQAQFVASDALNINQPTAQFGTMLASLKNPGSNPATFPPTTATRVLAHYVLSRQQQYTKSEAHAVRERKHAAGHGRRCREPSILIRPLRLHKQHRHIECCHDGKSESDQVGSDGAECAHSPDKLKRTNDYYHFGLVSKINVRNATFRNRYQ